MAIDFFVTPKKKKIIARAPKLSKVRKSRSAIRIVIKKVGNVGKMKQRREKKKIQKTRDPFVKMRDSRFSCVTPTHGNLTNNKEKK